MTKTERIIVVFATALLLTYSSASAQSISQVSGNGQLACEACPTHPITIFNPVVVLVKDAAGKPLPGATVSWTFNAGQSGFGNVTSTSTVTDANGQTSNTFTLTPALGSLFGVAWVQGTITATISALPAGTAGTTGQPTTFTETDALTDIQATGQGQGIVLITDNLVSPAPGTVLSGPAGSTSSTPIQVKLSGLNTGGGIPNVAVIIQAPTDPNQPSISCSTQPGQQPNTALTDGTGTATCNVVFGARTGLGSASVAVGQASPIPYDTFPINFQVLPGVPGSVAVSTGNNQSGNAGSNLPAPLVAVVGDQAGNPLSGVNVTWAIASGSGTLFNTRTLSDANGRVSANLTLGSTPGNVQVKVTVDGQPQIPAAVFTETVNLAISGFSAVSGGSQSTPVNTAFPAPLIVQVTNNGQPVAGVTVTFAVTSGSATLATPNAQTNAQGQAQTTVQAGATAGPLVITATIGNFSQAFNLTVSPPGPALTADSFKNAASLVSGAISPCSLATIVAQGVAPGIQGAILPPVVGLLPVLLNNTTVAFSAGGGPNAFAPIWDISNDKGQESMTIEIPCELSPGPVSVTVTVGTGSKQVNVTLQPAAPGIFQTAGSDNKLRAVIVRPDGSFATKENPARRGETVHVFVTGLGPVNPQIGTNQIGIPDTDSIVTDSVIVGINNNGVAVSGAKYARDLVGVYDLAFVVPADAPTGDVNLAVAVVLGGNFVFAQPSTIPIQ